MRKLFLAALCLFATSSHAVELSAVGALNFATVRASNSLGTTLSSIAYSPKMSLGFGAIVTATANPLINLELGALYIPRKTSTGVNSDQTLTMLEIPVLVRVDFVFFSVAAGGYYARGMGDVSFNNNGTETTRTWDSVSLRQNDFGLTGSVRLNLPLGPIVAVVIDARLNFGLANLDARALNSLQLVDIQALAGLKFNL